VFLGGTSVQSPPEAHASSRNIEIGAKVGFKNYYAKAHDRGAQAPEYPVAAILDYTERMGVEHGFTTRLLDFALGQLVRVETVEQFSILRTCPIGLEAPKTNLATQAANLCNQSTGRFDPDARLTTTEMNAAEFRRRILDYAERNIWWLGVVDTKSKLADRLHSSEFRKNDEVAAQLYADLKAAGIPLPSVVGSNFEVYGYNNGPYQMKCFASVSPVEADKYELIFLAQPGVTRTSNATGAARAAPDQCRGLLRRNRNEVINPHQH
jgi:hypothetical protein